MRVKLLLITSTLLLFSGCKSTYNSKAEAKHPLNKFMTGYIGLKKGDTIEKVYKIFGEPTKHSIHEDKYDFNTVYYDVPDGILNDPRALSFSYFKDTHKIYTIELHRAAAYFLQEKGVNENVYIDVHGDDLRKIFGPKEYGHVGNLRYEEEEFAVEFYCYDFNGNRCYSYDIYWWRR